MSLVELPYHRGIVRPPPLWTPERARRYGRRRRSPLLCATPTIVQQSTTGNNGTPATLGTVIGGAQTAGNTNVVIVAWNTASGALTGPQTDGSNTYTLFGGLQANVTSIYLYYCARITAAGAGARTVTANWLVGQSFPEVKVIEISGAAASPIDAPTVVFTGYSGSNSMSAGPVTTANANELPIGYNYNDDSSNGPGAGWSPITDAGTNGSGVGLTSGSESQYLPGALVAGTSVTATTPIGGLTNGIQLLFCIVPFVATTFSTDATRVVGVFAG